MHRTDDECKAIISSVAKHCDVSAKLMMERLIGEEDKEDLRHYRLDKRALIQAVIIWRDQGLWNFLPKKQNNL